MSLNYQKLKEAANKLVQSKKSESVVKVVQAQPKQTISGVTQANPTQRVVPQSFVGPVQPKTPASLLIEPVKPMVSSGPTTPASLLIPKSNPMVFPVTNMEPIKKQIENSVNEQTRSQRVNEFIKNTPGTVLRALPRAAISVGSTIFPTENNQELVPKSRLARFIYGDEPIGNIRQEGEKLSELAAVGGIAAAERLGKTNLEDDQKIEIINNIKKYKWLTVPLGILSVGSDLVPGVGGVKKQATKEVTEQLIKKYGLEVANEIVRQGDEVARRALTDEGVVKKFVSSIENFINDARPLKGDRYGFEVNGVQYRTSQFPQTYANPYTTQEERIRWVYNKLQENPDYFKGDDVARRALTDVGVVKQLVGAVTEDALLIEARKYKSVGEFTEKIKDLVMKKNAGIELLDDQKEFLKNLSEVGELKPSDIWNKANNLKATDTPQPSPRAASVPAADPNLLRQGTQIENPLATRPTRPGSKQVGPKLKSEIVPASKTSSYDTLRNPYDEVNAPKIKPIIDQLPEESKAAVKAASLLDPTEINPINRSLYQKMRDSVAESWTKIRETVQDDWIRVKKLIDNPNTKKATDSLDPYTAETLMHGRTASRIEDMKLRVSDIDKDLVKTSKRIKIQDADLKKDVNEFLRSTHAPERNFELGDGAAGVTTEQAAKNLDELKSKPHFREIERLAKQVSELNKRVLETLKEGGVISQKDYNNLLKTYPNHVPLNRILPDEENIFDALTERGLNVSRTGLRKAKGSQLEVADILTNVTANLEQAIIRAEKNRVDNATLAFARANKHLGIFEEVPVRMGNNDPLILKMFENGKQVHLKINDVHLAAALRGVNRQYLPSLLKFIPAFTRLYSGLATRFNPEFVIPNKIRDIQEMMVYAAAEKELGFKSAVKAGIKDSASVKDVFDWMRGKDTAGTKLYNQMRLDGGTTGGMGLSTRKAVELDLEKIRKLNRSNPKKAVQQVIQSIDNLNTIIEDSTRLSVYKQALANGVSRERAAFLAKNATINFNKMGTGGPVVNALYMFSNASIQGTTKMLRAMKNPKVAAAVVTTVGAAVAATNEFNDKVDPDWREKVTEWDRMNNLIIALPTDDGIKYVKIPVSWGMKPIKVSAEYVMDLSQGRVKLNEALEGTLSAAMDAYNPVGGTDIRSAATPTILDTPVDIWSNRAWHGGKIKPDVQPDAAEASKFFKSLEKTQTGRVLKGATSWLFKATDGKVDISPADINYAYEQYTGGAGRFATRVLNTLTAVGKGEVGKLPVREIPVVNRFLGSRSSDEVGDTNMPIGKFYDIKKQDTKEASFRKMEARGLYDRLMELPIEERKQKVQELQRSGQLDKETIDSLFNVFKEEMKQQARQRTDLEEQIKKAPVKTRGRYLYEIMKDMETNEKAELARDWIQKGIITKEVMEQFIQASRE